MSKTIEERAKEYAPDAFNPDEILPAREQYLVDLERRGYIEGATVEHELLTKWHSLEETPEPYKYVLLKVDFLGSCFDTGYVDEDGEWKLAFDVENPDIRIVAWREIHE